jgi:hypothetical protein
MHRAGLAVDGVIARPSAEAGGPPEEAGCAPAAPKRGGHDVSSGGQLGLLSARAIERSSFSLMLSIAK